MSAGRIVDGHGDLLADDIFCLDDGPRILDCLEFDDRLRWLDGLDDAAFLAMDLERLGQPGLADQFTRWYLEFSGDPAPTALRHHYVAYRAFVRAKVACLQAGQGEPHAAGQARQLTAMTLRHLRAGAVTLVLIGGLPATGKSVIAGALADRLGFTVLGSDRVRKELAGVDPGAQSAAGYGGGIYAPPWTERTYRELISRAARLLAMGESVILDASWLSARQRGCCPRSRRGGRRRSGAVALRRPRPVDGAADEPQDRWHIRRLSRSSSPDGGGRGALARSGGHRHQRGRAGHHARPGRAGRADRARRAGPWRQCARTAQMTSGGRSARTCSRAERPACW